MYFFTLCMYYSVLIQSVILVIRSVSKYLWSDEENVCQECEVKWEVMNELYKIDVTRGCVPNGNLGYEGAGA